MRPAGRPRAFDADAALAAAALRFWRHGYAGTSLDELTAAMGIGRSSFYALYGSKRDVMLAALALYTTRLQGQLEAAADAAPDARRAVLAIVDGIACTDQPDHGCLFVNAVSELAPHDAGVRTLGQAHMARVDALLVRWLKRLGLTTARARSTSSFLITVALGAITARKAGATERQVKKTLDTAAATIDAARQPPSVRARPPGPVGSAARA